MASHSEPRILGYSAGADLSAKQYHVVKFGTSDKEVVDADAQEGFGVLMSQSPDGQGCEVALPGGGAKAKLAGTITRGESITADANGAFVAAGSSQRAIGIAMASGVAGDVIPMEVNIHLTAA